MTAPISRGHWPHPDDCDCESCRPREPEAAELAELRIERPRVDPPVLNPYPLNLGGCPCEECEAVRRAIRRHYNRLSRRVIDVPDVSDDAFADFPTC